MYPNVCILVNCKFVIAFFFYIYWCVYGKYIYMVLVIKMVIELEQQDHMVSE